MRALVVRESSPRRPALEVAVSHALVERVSEGSLGAVLRLYRPAATVAFGRLDALRPGFAAAAAAAREHGFEPVLRAPGGHAVAYHEGCLVVDELVPADDPLAHMQDRFAHSGEVLAAALRALGVDSAVGRVPGEFCPGEYTVNARGVVKLVGTAQRVLRHASLLAASVAVTDADRLRDVLRDVYGALELEWHPATAGAVADEVGGVALDDVERAVLDEYARRWELVDASLDARALEQARKLEPRHEVAGGGALIQLVRAELHLMDAALAGDEALARALGHDVVAGWATFTEALQPARDAVATDPSRSAWGTRFFVAGDPPELVGWGGFKGPPEDGVVELGYEIAEARRGRGLATAAVQAMLAEAFADERVTTVIAHTLPERNASNRVLEKAGFRYDGEAQENGEVGWRFSLTRT